MQNKSPITNSEGTGLGLAISRRLVDLMGGELMAESRLDEGSQFTFIIPFKEASALIHADDQSKMIVGFRQNRKPHVVVVDDKLENRSLVRDLLEPLGFVVGMADSGRSGFELVVHTQPDLVITDLVMPELDGFELIRRLREHPQGVSLSIIAMSASVVVEKQQRSLDLGSNAFLAKPVQADELLSLIGQLLDLEWVYAEEIGATADQLTTPAQLEEPIRFPPPEIIASLLHNTRRGAVGAIRADIDRLVEENAAYAPFYQQVSTYLNRYQIEKLLIWLEAGEKI